jgi:hypothetical protein
MTELEKRMSDQSQKINLENLDEQVLALIGSTINHEYVIPAWDVRKNVPENNIQNFKAMLDDLLVGNNIFLVGPAGTGKTACAAFLCDTLYGSPAKHMATINCSQWTSPIDIIGGETIKGYREGILVDAYENGKLLVLDELPKLDPNTAGLLNDPLAKSGIQDATRNTITTGQGRVVSKHPKFACIATGNITGKRASPKYGGNNKQDASLIDRFAGSYYEIGFNRPLEKSLVGETVFAIFDSMRDVLLENEIENDITLRIMLNAYRTWRKEMESVIKGKTIGKTLRMTIDSYLSLHDADTKAMITSKLGTRLTNFSTTYRSAEKIADYKKQYA